MLNGSCTVSSDGCFYSPLFPLPYPQFATCELEALAAAALHRAAGELRHANARRQAVRKRIDVEVRKHRLRLRIGA